MKICANSVGRNSEIIIKTNEKETMIVVLITEYEVKQAHLQLQDGTEHIQKHVFSI